VRTRVATPSLPTIAVPTVSPWSVNSTWLPLGTSKSLLTLARKVTAWPSAVVARLVEVGLRAIEADWRPWVDEMLNSSKEAGMNVAR
jgi:hypothetical protein